MHNVNAQRLRSVLDIQQGLDPICPPVEGIITGRKKTNTKARPKLIWLGYVFINPTAIFTQSIKQNKMKPNTHLSQVCRLHARCESCQPCSQGRQSSELACWGHPWGNSSPYHGDVCSSYGAGNPRIRGGEPKIYGGTVKTTQFSTLSMRHTKLYERTSSQYVRTRH